MRLRDRKKVNYSDLHKYGSVLSVRDVEEIKVPRNYEEAVQSDLSDHFFIIPWDFDFLNISNA